MAARDVLERITGGALGEGWRRTLAGEMETAPSEEALVNGDIVAVTLLVAEQLERLGVPYALGGSLASPSSSTFAAACQAVSLSSPSLVAFR